jgi:hypothetical protein
LINGEEHVNLAEAICRNVLPELTKLLSIKTGRYEKFTPPVLQRI